MSSIILNLNKQFENRVRLGVMSILVVNDWVEFNILKEMLDVTDGNLASHLSALEKNEFIEVRKQFIGRKPKTSYRITMMGRNAFKLHIDALENLINSKK